YTSQIFVEGKLPRIKSSNITTPDNWDEAGWIAASSKPFDTQLAANPDYFFATLMHSHLGEYYNEYVSGEIYGQLANRLLDHFLNDKLVGTLTGAVKNLLVGENSVLNNIGGGNLFGTNEQQLLNEMAQYMITVIIGKDENIGGLYGKGNGYPYEGKTYANIIEYLRGVIDNTIGRRDASTVIDGLQYGSEKLNKISLGDLLVNTYVSHIMGRDLFSDINTPNNSLSKPQPELDVPNTADNPGYRLRLQAAITDFLAQCESGKFAKDLIGAVLDPLYNNENSLIKTLLQYPFDFTKANLTEPQKQQLKNIVKLLNPLLKILTGSEVDIQIDMKHFVLGDLISNVLPALGGLLSDKLGLNLTSNDPTTILNGFLDSYLVDSLYVGLGGIVGNIVTSLAVDKTPDFADIANTTTKHLVKPYKEYGNHTYISNVKPAGSYNLPTQSNGRLPSKVTANFDNKDSTTSFTIKFYTAEDVFGTFRFKENANDNWTEISTTQYTNNSLVETLVEKFYSASSTITSNGVTATIKTEAIPQYVPLMDIGLLAATHSAVDYELLESIDSDTYIEKLYGGLDRDNAPKNSVLYYNCHTVTITGLKAGAEYLYDIGGNYTLSSDKTPEIATDNLLEFSLAESCAVNNFTFETALPGTAETFDFLAIADIQGMVEGMYDNSFKAMDTLMKDSKTNGYDFILNAGDMTDNGKNFTQWGYALDTYLPTFANTSTFLAPGNHEKGSNALSTFYNYTTPTDMSMNRGEDGYYYSFNYGNAHFTVLDTNDADKNGLSQQQMNWLYQDLTANVNCKWKFVLMHKSMFSLGAHSFDREVVAMRDSLPRLFQSYGVNMVFGGHDHTYTTTKLIDADGIAVDAPANENGVLYKNAGVLYITLGTMGTKFYEYVENSAVKPNVDLDNSISKTLDSQTFGYISVDRETIAYKGYKLDNASQKLTEISNIVLSTDKAIAVNAVIAANASTPEKYIVKFSSYQIDEIVFETSKVSCDYTVTYISNGKEYEKINQIKLKNKNTAIDIALKDNLGNVSVVKSIIVEKDNYALIISLLVVGLAVVLAGAITIPVVLKVKKTKRKKA
ncbi:MAG: metallophosphoesterase, partial [Clostridia bacterium]